MHLTFVSSASAVMTQVGPAAGAGPFELRFETLFKPGRALAFPCDERGRVEMDGLSDAVRDNYLYARAVVGRVYGIPAVVTAGSAAH